MIPFPDRTASAARSKKSREKSLRQFVLRARCAPGSPRAQDHHQDSSTTRLIPPRRIEFMLGACRTRAPPAPAPPSMDGGRTGPVDLGSGSSSGAAGPRFLIQSFMALLFALMAFSSDDVGGWLRDRSWPRPSHLRPGWRSHRPDMAGSATGRRSVRKATGRRRQRPTVRTSIESSTFLDGTRDATWRWPLAPPVDRAGSRPGGGSREYRVLGMEPRSHTSRNVLRARAGALGGRATTPTYSRRRRSTSVLPYDTNYAALSVHTGSPACLRPLSLTSDR